MKVLHAPATSCKFENPAREVHLLIALTSIDAHLYLCEIKNITEQISTPGLKRLPTAHFAAAAGRRGDIGPAKDAAVQAAAGGFRAPGMGGAAGAWLVRAACHCVLMRKV